MVADSIHSKCFWCDDPADGEAMPGHIPYCAECRKEFLAGTDIVTCPCHDKPLFSRSHVSDRLSSKRKIKCTFVGCDAELPLSGMQGHWATACIFIRVACKDVSLGCYEKIPKKNGRKPRKRLLL